MFEQKYGFSAHKITGWLSLYFIFVIPTYTILCEANMVYCLPIIFLESIIDYYLMEDSFIKELIDDLNTQDLIFLFMGIASAILNMTALLVIRPLVFAVLIFSGLSLRGIRNTIMNRNQE